MEARGNKQRVPWTASSTLCLIFAFLVLSALVGCSADSGGDHVANQPPTVWLSSAPPEGDATKYRLQLYWGGWDPDGEVSHYEYVITDNEDGLFDPADTTTSPDGVSPWHKVVSNDSLFTFSADVLVDSSATNLVTRFERSHTFFIRAVDEQGLASVEPSYRSFTAWTLSPSVTISVPKIAGAGAALVPAITTYKWKAEDYVNSLLQLQEPDSVRWILHPIEGTNWEDGFEYIRTHPNSPDWSPWAYYRAPEDSGKSWTTPPTDVGTYVFAVQAKDEAGAVTPVFDERYNMRRIQVSRKLTGPQLNVYNEFVGTISTWVTTKPPVIIDIPAGVPMQFTFWGNADDYGGIVSGYRYGWDIADLNDPSQWEVSYTPFTGTTDPQTARSPARKFFFGTHTFDIEIVDNSGYLSRVEVKVNVIQFTMAKPLLHVDDFAPKGAGLTQTKGLVPNDDEHDSFWKEVLSDVAGFSWEEDAIEVKAGRDLSIVKLADYQNMIWDTYGGYDVAAASVPKIYDLIQYRPRVSSGISASGKIQPNLIALFMQAGGHVMVCGYQPLTQVVNPTYYPSTERYPFIFRYELGGNQSGDYHEQIESGDAVGEKSFAYQDACVNVLDICYTGNAQIRTNFDNGCGVERIRVNDDFQENYGLREALPLGANPEGFPLLELRPEVADPGKAYAPDEQGLNSEVYNPPFFAFCENAGLTTPRPCIQPIYGNGCLGGESVELYEAPVAIWSSTYANVAPEQGGGVAARSVFMGFEPFYFKPEQVKEMMNIIAFDEWKLERK